MIFCFTPRKNAVMGLHPKGGITPLHAGYHRNILVGKKQENFWSLSLLYVTCYGTYRAVAPARFGKVSHGSLVSLLFLRGWKYLLRNVLRQFGHGPDLSSFIFFFSFTDVVFH